MGVGTPTTGASPSARRCPGGTPFAYLPFEPDAGPSCGENSVNAGQAGLYDGFSINGGHEYAEAITDPYPSSGWADANGEENGDKCAWTNLADIGWSGARYAVQSLWSNASHGCVLQLPTPTPTPTPLRPRRPLPQAPSRRSAAP